MLTTVAFLVLALSGFTLSWSSSPSRIENTGSAEVSVTISEDDLLQVSSDSGFIVSYEISATIDGENFVRQSNTLTNNTFPVYEVLSYNSLVEGEHIVTVTLTDLESGGSNSKEIELIIDAVNSDLWSSSGLRISPNGIVRSSSIVELLWSVYLPLPQSDLEVNPRAAYALLDKDAEVVLEGWLTGELVEPGIVSYNKDIFVTGTPKGRYRFTVVALLDDSLVASSSSSISIIDSWDLWGNNAEETITLIRPIATTHEIAELERAGGLGDRNSVMADFWIKRDPFPSTSENEYLEMYLLRLDFISQEFSTTGIRGINTDRGVVYAKMGEPDIIENHPFELGNYPYILWEYFTPSLSLSFADYNGYGYYVMEESWTVVDRAFNLREEWLNE